MNLAEISNIQNSEIAGLIDKANYIQICGHTSPDGDCISSQLALKLALEKMGKKVDVLLALNEAAPHTLDFLPGFSDLIYAGRVKRGSDLFIVVDAPNDARIGYVAANLKNKSKVSLTIDHHFETKRSCDFALVDTSSASTSILIWELLGTLELVDIEVANCCLTGVKTDTGNFQYQNADLRAFKRALEMIEEGANNSLISEKVFMRRSLSAVKIEQIAVSNMEVFCDTRAVITSVSRDDLDKCSASKDDTEGIVNILRSLDGSEVVAFLREDSDCTKVSFRSTTDIDCRELAGIYGGGGHRGAAGAKIEQSLSEARETVKKQLQELLG